MMKALKNTRIHRFTSKCTLPVLGLASLAWYLIRVIPKPSRAAYPCMRAAMPLASGFVLWLIGLLISAFAFMRAKAWLRRSNYLYAGLFAMTGFVTLVLFQDHSTQARSDFATMYLEPNRPIGEAKGIFPGRVVWVYDPDATNESCIPGRYGHGWFLNENNDQQVIDEMVSGGIRSLTAAATDSAAWENIFRYYNQNAGKGDVGYADNEIIFVKINVTSSWSGNINLTDFTKIQNQWYGISETSPHLVLSVLRQLVYVVGVPQQNIYIGDPMKHIYKHCYDLWHAEFPDVHYLDQSETHGGREKVKPSNSAVIYYSDRGKVLREGTWEDASAGDPIYEDHFYTIFEEMDYMINLPTLKAHKHAGMTAFAKNHFGSHTRPDAKHLHNGLVAPEQYNPRRAGYGLYRVQVDLLSHELIGEKNLFYMMDGLWAADYEIGVPRKFMMAPFNDDWMSSIFVSFDPVAIESVGFDFLRTEFTADRGLETYPQMEGVDDYLHQAADSTTWPDSIYYDPENDGVLIGSIGVHEHWNNADDKQYTRNLGTGEGIELMYLDNQTTTLTDETSNTLRQFNLMGNYPNPFNASTVIEYEVGQAAKIRLEIYNLLGMKIRILEAAEKPAGRYSAFWNGCDQNGMPVGSGTYFYRLSFLNRNEVYSISRKMILIK